MGSDRLRETKFIFIGNHACLDFINTLIVRNGQPVDLIETFLDLVSWLEQAGLLDRQEAEQAEQNWNGKPQGIRTFEQAREFRASLRKMVERIAEGKPVSVTTIEAINSNLRYRVGYPQLTRRRGTFDRAFRVDSQEANQLLALLAESASELLCTVDFALIKRCQNPLCVLFFYDTTKNHARHWCSMSVCGNRLKVAAYYRRHREQ